MEKSTKKSLAKLIDDNLYISLRSFEKEIGITRQTLAKISNNEDYRPSVLTVKRICKYFNVDYKDYI
jgi:DNA-binding XRE family transcriptional regulator